MNSIFQIISGSITAPQGFRAGSAFCDIKKVGTGKGSNRAKKGDIALIVSDVPATVAGLFTTNQVCAAPVKLSQARAAGEFAQAIVVNSGNANACTGAPGMRSAESMAAETAKALDIPEKTVLVCSTGRIGVQLPMPNVRRGIAGAAATLGSTLDDGHAVAEAIMTSDTRPKEIAVSVNLGGHVVKIGGICKGAGMIQPGMSATGRAPAARPLHATMLCFLTTDAAIGSAALKKALSNAVGQSFNRITVDGDMSTNDSAIILANGMSGAPKIDSKRELLARFQQALDFVTLQLAQMIVRDGEGASRFITVHVTGARSFEEADYAARAVANSPLVKTSWCGGDPNWGRILAALGYSRARIVENCVDIAYSPPGSKKRMYSLKKGLPTTVAFKTLCAITAQKEFELHIFLNQGAGDATMYSSDLTEDYVDFNKGDVTDPASLGG